MDSDQLLRAFPFLRSVDPADLERLHATRVERGAGEPFFLQGDPGDAVYGVLTGRVKIAKQSPAGRELILDVLGPGEPIAVIPVVVVTGLYGESGTAKLLVLSQVVLSMQLPFAVIPLVRFVSDRQLMGPLVVGRKLMAVAWTIAGIIVALNLKLLFDTVTGA